MQVLLDTHIALWMLWNDRRLSNAARTIICAPSASVFVSAASLWEVAIKRGLERGRSEIPITADAMIVDLTSSGARILPIDAGHAALIETLPPIHQDPFDRMLVAQARSEGLQLLTSDPVVARYGSGVVLV